MEPIAYVKFFLICLIGVELCACAECAYQHKYINSVFYILQDDHYDFNYQEYRTLPNEVTVLPGDELIMECDFETTGNETFIFVSLKNQGIQGY